MRNTLSEWTTFGIGGAARRIVKACSREALIELCSDGLVLGRGSNVLVSDDGYDGNVVINRYGDVERRGNVIVAGSGASLAAVCGHAAECGLSGLEWACGIPGTVGGAVVMNAGAFCGEIADAILYADVFRGGSVVRLTRAELGFGYRTSAITADDTVIAAAFELKPDSAAAVRARGQKCNAVRRRAQPRGKSAGSVFKNPPGASVGRILDEAGLKGVRHGGAVISAVHANIIVNTGGATASDVVALISKMRAAICARGYAAQEEIRYIGGF